MTTIALDSGTEHEIIERLQRQLSEREAKLKKISIENALMNEKLSQLTAENKELTQNLDELDQQHSLAMEEVLKSKKIQTEKISAMEKDLEKLQKTEKMVKDLEEKLKSVTKSHTDLEENYKKVEKSYLSALESEKRLKDELEVFKNELESLVLENVELKAAIETKETSTRGELDNILVENKKCMEELKKISHENSELQAKVARFEEELAKNASKTAETDQNANLLERIKNLEDEITAICIENSKYKDDFELANQEKDEMFAELCERKKALDEFTIKFEHDMLDVKDKVKFMEDLEEENEKLKKKLRDLESGDVPKSAENISFAEMKELIKTHFSFDSNLVSEKDYFDDFLESTKDVTSKLKATERQLMDSVHELNVLKEAYAALENEKEILKTDLLNYEVECSELVKNNDILVMEVETLKTGKLETIPEQNEDIEILEQQLVDCNNEAKSKLDEFEVEKTNMLERIDGLSHNLMEMECKKRDLEMYIEGLENEKSNLLFEINELKADKGVSNTDDDAEEQISELEDQIHNMKRDNSELLKKIQTLEGALLESEHTFGTLQASLEEQKSEKSKYETEIAELNHRISTLQAELKESVQLGIETRLQLETEVSELQEKLKKSEENHSATQKNQQHEQDLVAETKINALETQISDLDACNGQLQAQITALNETIAATVHEKNELMHKLQEKTQENANFQGEIVRITQLHEVAAANCESLTQKLASLEADLKAAANKDAEKTNDQMHFLREKADILTANLLTEQNNQKLLQNEKIQLIEKNQNLTKDLERLREHLLEVEDGHTQEVMQLQKMIDEQKQRLADMEGQVKQSSTAYTSANIRANQQVEVLQNQYKLLVQQRDEISAKLSAAEDREEKHQAALTNLQCVLEQFQRDKQTDIDAACYKLRKDIEKGKEEENHLREEIDTLLNQLADAKQGLAAASRLSDQLETSNQTISKLKSELSRFQDKYLEIETKMQQSEQNQADKVEKQLVKNMLIGYIVAPNGTDKQQILKLLSAILDLNQEELAKVGLLKPSGWLGGLLASPGQQNTYNRESLSQAFVKFLETESSPRAPSAELLSLHKDTPTPVKAPPTPVSGTHSRSSSIGSAVGTTTMQTPTTTPHKPDRPTVAVQPILLNEGILQPTFVPQRNSSAILKDILNDS
ncbi:thyroid receptor-interacting protein 11 isoform X2 [Culicoides brevitarsis]